jgi:GDP-4-dehydro-6-deoxy-D-mannose reductase
VKVLITGIGGFAGSHLAELGLQAGAEVIGLDRPGAPAPSLAALGRGVRVLSCDLAEPGAAARALEEARPDRVFHLAGASAVGASWSRRAEVLRANLEAAVQVLEGLRRRPAPALLVSSAEVYGLVPEARQPVGEDEPLAPVSPYGLSKACLELAAACYARAEGVPVVVARPFNHVGPRQGPGFVWSDIARQVAAIERGDQRPVLEIGATATRRDFTDVRDVVRAYWALLERAGPGQVYNVASERAVAIEEVLRGFLALARRPIEVRPAADRLRPVDIPLLVGRAARVRELTGWRPEVPLERSLADVLEDWRGRDAGAAAARG